MLHTVGYTESEKYRALDNLQQSTIDLCLIYCGWEECDPGHRFGPNRRLSNILHIVENGEGVFEMNDQKYYLKRGDVFFIPAGREAWYEADKEQPWTYRWIGFEGMDAEVCCARAGFTFQSPVRNIDCIEPAKWCIDGMMDASQLLPENSLRRSGLLQILFGELVADYRKKCLEEGETLPEYLINVRVERAKSLLQKTDIQINEVAAKVGYSDPLAFSKIFKRKTGYSPTEYKEARSRLVFRNVKGEYIGIRM